MNRIDLSLQETLEQIQDLLAKVNDPRVDSWDPVKLGLLLAKLEYENLDVSQEYASFSDLVEPHKAEYPSACSLKERTFYVSKVFSEILGFKGDTNNYYNVKNSFLNDVFVRRKGIPLSLSLVYMGVAQALGLRAVGIAFPGHFLVRTLDNKGVQVSGDDTHWQNHWFVDAFENGKIITVEECKERLKTWTRNVIPFGPEALRVAHPVDIVSRTLRNLKAIFQEKEDLPRLYWVLTALVELCPLDRLDSLKERGFLFARMGRYNSAVKDLKNFLDQVPNAHQFDHVEQMLRYFELQIELTN